MGDTETDVKHELTDRDVADLSKAALVAEWKQAYETLQISLPDDEREQIWDRRQELWNEMKRRTDAEAPECPDCGTQRWVQSLGDPKHCGGCGLTLGERHEELIAEINAYWNKVQSPGGVEA